MKKLLMLAFTLLWAVKGTCATPYLVPLTYDENQSRKGTPRHAPAQLPTVICDENMITISVPFDIPVLEVIIRDVDGAVLHSSVLSISSSAIITLPEYIVDDIYSIELLYGGTHLIGYF